MALPLTCMCEVKILESLDSAGLNETTSTAFLSVALDLRSK